MPREGGGGGRRCARWPRRVPAARRALPPPRLPAPASCDVFYFYVLFSYHYVSLICYLYHLLLLCVLYLLLCIIYLLLGGARVGRCECPLPGVCCRLRVCSLLCLISSSNPFNTMSGFVFLYLASAFACCCFAWQVLFDLLSGGEASQCRTRLP